MKVNALLLLQFQYGVIRSEWIGFAFLTFRVIIPLVVHKKAIRVKTGSKLNLHLPDIILFPTLLNRRNFPISEISDQLNAARLGRLQSKHSLAVLFCRNRCLRHRRRNRGWHIPGREEALRVLESKQMVATAHFYPCRIGRLPSVIAALEMSAGYGKPKPALSLMLNEFTEKKLRGRVTG